MSFMLIHSPLIGPSSWAAVAIRLAAAGHEVFVPDIRTAPSVESFWRRQVVNAVEAIEVEVPVTLVAHSGAGPLLPAIGAAMHGRVVGYVFVDAALPHPGRSRLEALPRDFAERVRSLAVGGVLPPWHEWFPKDTIERMLPDSGQRALLIRETPRLPLSMFTEPFPVIDGWPDADCAYVRLSDAYDDEARSAGSLGWDVTTLDANHLSIMTEPERIAALLVP